METAVTLGAGIPLTIVTLGFKGLQVYETYQTHTRFDVVVGYVVGAVIAAIAAIALVAVLATHPSHLAMPMYAAAYPGYLTTVLAECVIERYLSRRHRYLR